MLRSKCNFRSNANSHQLATRFVDSGNRWYFREKLLYPFSDYRCSIVPCDLTRSAAARYAMRINSDRRCSVIYCYQSPNCLYDKTDEKEVSLFPTLFPRFPWTTIRGSFPSLVRSLTRSLVFDRSQFPSVTHERREDTIGHPHIYIYARKYTRVRTTVFVYVWKSRERPEGG